MVIGFTGTREGMTEEQKERVRKFLVGFNPVSVRHGDCVGADQQFNEIADELEVSADIHPPIDESKRAFCDQLYDNVVHVWPRKDYLERDRDIVDCSDMLIATPKEYKNAVRSGTWYTVRYALRTYQNPTRKVWIVLPDGAIIHDLP